MDNKPHELLAGVDCKSFASSYVGLNYKPIVAAHINDKPKRGVVSTRASALSYTPHTTHELLTGQSLKLFSPLSLQLVA